MATMPCCKIMPFLMRFRTLSWIRFEVQTLDIFVCNLHGQKRQKTTVPGDDFSGCAITGFISCLNYVHVCGLVFNGVVRMQWPTRCVCWQWPEWNKKYCINFSLCDLQIENILKNRRHAIFFRWHEKKKQRQGSTCMICSFKTNSFL